MKKHSAFIIFTLFLINSQYITAQDESVRYENRICQGFGGETGFLGVDYSHEICKSKLFLGIGAGIGTGWTGYVRYEPISWWGFGPFISSGASHAFGGTLIVSPGTSIFSASAGLNYLPKFKWSTTPVFGVGCTYYSIIAGNAEGEINSFGPLIKIGIAFSKRQIRSLMEE